MRVKTTLELERPLYLALKKKAAEEKKTLKKVMDEIIVAWMNSEKSAIPTPPARRELFPRARGLGARIDISDPKVLKEFLAEEEAQDFLRRQ
ncbi:MAG: hypothetical protein J0L53_02755 [Spirochaetes bacterium]|nr:hypothetical protein [Spirochaetota bacterium]